MYCPPTKYGRTGNIITRAEAKKSTESQLRDNKHQAKNIKGIKGNREKHPHVNLYSLPKQKPVWRAWKPVLFKILTNEDKGLSNQTKSLIPAP